MNQEEKRLKEQQKEHLERSTAAGVPIWDKWGPYVAERGWGTVREDYSESGDAWSYFTHDQARLRAYRRAEDGLAGISDRFQVLLFAPAFWNGKDPILKERLFGLNAWEGNHGEDVKELYYYLDATPTSSYLKYLYKYPQERFPYEKLLEENRRRGAEDREFELFDTGVFEEDRYFDIFIEYAKAGPEDLCIRIEAINRAKEAAPLYILPHLWFRNSWGWSAEKGKPPKISLEESSPHTTFIADDREMEPPRALLFKYRLGKRYLYACEGGEPLFTNNETNAAVLWQGENSTPYVKDAFHRYLIHEEKGAVNPEKFGTKAALCYFFPKIEPGQSQVVYLRLTDQELKEPLKGIEKVFKIRKKEADAFFKDLHPKKASAEEKAIQRQAISGMIWNKQCYIYDVGHWIQGDDPNHPPPEGHKHVRNIHWRHILSMRVFSMPDKWEYPWFAAWDLTFHCLAYSLFDIHFAKNQLWLLLFDQFQHPNGEIPAYEWEFSDVNPPVQAWATLKIYEYEKKKTGKGDRKFLEKCFHKLLLNFSWWVNRVDQKGNNVFEGGFLGMDNLGFNDPSQKLPPGYLLDQADGAGWVSLLCLNLMRIALILSKENAIYEGLGIKFFQHFIFVTAAMRRGYWRNYDMWDEKAGFFYSFLRHPDGKVEEIPIRSLIGLIPFFACDLWDEKELKSYPDFYASYEWFLQKRKALAEKCVHRISQEGEERHFLGLLNELELQKILKYIWDPGEFRSEFGLRSLSKYHEKNPAKLGESLLSYEPGESKLKIKGGNSNWRGPIWFPINFLLIDTLYRLNEAFGDRFSVQVENEPKVTLKEMADSFCERLINLFKKDATGRRPFYGEYEKFQNDPNFKDYFLFYEHFHGESGRGLGASHQTGWTGLVINLIEMIRN